MSSSKKIERKRKTLFFRKEVHSTLKVEGKKSTIIRLPFLRKSHSQVLDDLPLGSAEFSRSCIDKTSRLSLIYH